MNKRTFNGIAWTLFVFGSFLIVTGDLGFELGRPIHISYFGVLLATLSVPLFWFGGYNIDRCRRMRADRS